MIPSSFVSFILSTCTSEVSHQPSSIHHDSNLLSFPPRWGTPTSILAPKLLVWWVLSCSACTYTHTHTHAKGRAGRGWGHATTFPFGKQAEEGVNQKKKSFPADPSTADQVQLLLTLPWGWRVMASLSMCASTKLQSLEGSYSLRDHGKETRH